MYDDIISKMTTHFSEIGSILYSKAYDFFKKDLISTEEIETYYDLLCSDEIISQKPDTKEPTEGNFVGIIKPNEKF